MHWHPWYCFRSKRKALFIRVLHRLLHNLSLNSFGRWYTFLSTTPCLDKVLAAYSLKELSKDPSSSWASMSVTLYKIRKSSLTKAINISWGLYTLASIIQWSCCMITSCSYISSSYYVYNIISTYQNDIRRLPDSFCSPRINTGQILVHKVTQLSSKFNSCWPTTNYHHMQKAIPVFCWSPYGKEKQDLIPVGWGISLSINYWNYHQVSSWDLFLIYICSMLWVGIGPSIP